MMNAVFISIERSLQHEDQSIRNINLLDEAVLSVDRSVFVVIINKTAIGIHVRPPGGGVLERQESAMLVIDVFRRGLVVLQASGEVEVGSGDPSSSTARNQGNPLH